MIKQLSITIIILAVFLTGLPAQAQTVNPFSNIVVVADDLSEAERLAKKADLTQGALEQAVARVEQIELDLNSLDFEEGSREALMKTIFLADMATHKAFYQDKLLALDEVDSLATVDSLIKEVISYRETTYSPATRSALEFLLVFSYGPEAMETANNRLIKIEQDLNKLAKLNLLEDGAFLPLLEEARNKLDQAQSLQGLSVQKLVGDETINVDEEAETISASEETSTPEGVVEEGAEIAQPETETVEPQEEDSELLNIDQLEPRDLAEMSLSLIKDAYVIFMEAGTRVKAALGIEPEQEESVLNETTE